MAIAPEFPGLKVTVNVDGHPLIEYKDDDIHDSLKDEPQYLQDKAVSKFIEAKSNQEFTVDIELSANFKTSAPCLVFRLILDGKAVTAPIFRDVDQVSHEVRKRTVHGVEIINPSTGSEVTHHMQFTNIATVSDDQKLHDMAQEIKEMASRGRIEVQVFRGGKPRKGKGPQRADPSEMKTPSQVHEKALKGQAKTHGITTGRTTPSDTVWWDIPYLDGLDSPVAVFYFHYRSLEALKQIQVVPRSPEPEEAPSPPKPIKKEKRRSDHLADLPDSTQTKSGASQSRSKRRKSKYKVTVDLTNDTDSDSESAISVA